MIRKLIWKEWIEQRWKLAFGCVILMGFTAIGLHTRIVEDRSILTGAVALGAFILPLLIGMGVVASDRESGSLGALLALPVRPTVVLAIKVLTGMAVCLVPLLGVGVMTWALAGQREVAAADTAKLLALGALAACMVLLWTVALGIRLRTEARVALLGMAFLVLGVASLWLVYIPLYFGHPGMQAAWQVGLMRACLIHPVALVWPPHQWQESLAPIIRLGVAVQVPVALVLWWVLARRLGPATGGRS